MTVSELPPLLTSLLAQRTSPGRPAIINLLGDPAVFRFEAFAGLEPQGVTLDALTNHELPWRSVGRVNRMFGQLSEELALAGSRSGAGALLPFLTALAGDWAARLAEQLGSSGWHGHLARGHDGTLARRQCHPCPSARPDCWGSRFQSQYDACLRDTQQAQKIAGQVGDSLMECMRLPPDGCSGGDCPAMLRLEMDHGDIHVSWLTPDGRELCREALPRLVDRVCSSTRLVRLLDDAKIARSRQEQHWAAGNDLLRGACPELAEVLGRAVENNRPVGQRIWTGKARGLPAEVSLFIDPVTEGGGNPRATLVARRAHEEFVLGNAKGQLFYFPPIQLMARVDFTPTSPPWYVIRPQVRMPQNGPAWRHPYTGSLNADHFSKAELLTGGQPEAMVAVSDDARRLLPSLAQNGYPNCAGVSDLCLHGQDLRVKKLVETTCRIGPFRHELHLSALVEGLWEIARVGLTRAHQNNAHMPRLSLTCGNMCYEISGRAALEDTSLTNRVFPYNPRAF